MQALSLLYTASMRGGAWTHELGASRKVAGTPRFSTGTAGYEAVEARIRASWQKSPWRTGAGDQGPSWSSRWPARRAARSSVVVAVAALPSLRLSQRLCWPSNDAQSLPPARIVGRLTPRGSSFAQRYEADSWDFLSPRVGGRCRSAAAKGKKWSVTRSSIVSLCRSRLAAAKAASRQNFTLPREEPALGSRLEVVRKSLGYVGIAGADESGSCV
jgi:hypothetical protein